MDIQNSADRISASRPATRAPGEAELHQLLVEWNQTAEDYPRDLCFHQLFETQVERSPEATAVEFEGQRLTYAELNNHANQLANRLRRLGVGPEVLVGICVSPSLEMIAGLLGILKAGGAYVPMDPAYPAERLAFMMDDTAMPVLVTQESLGAVLPAKRVHVVCIDDLLRAGEREPSIHAAQNPASGVTAENLAYVIYTSGSTGQPKGVMIPHRGLVNYLSWAVQAYGVADGTGAPVHSSISFDLTITALFAPLLAGRCVHVLAGNTGSLALDKALADNELFSLVKITPAHLELLQNQWSRNAVSGRKSAFVIGGEALFGDDLAFWQEHAPHTVLVNEYGPTETVVGCCVYFVPKGERLFGRVPIGRPIANTQLYILDAEMRPAGLGESGELYIGGDGVARGYLNRPDLTQASFVSNPFVDTDPKASSKLYKTGDLVRYRSDGNLEFIGRIDDQVKIRGYRIEPGEIEEVLTAHPGVQGAKVIAHKDSHGDESLAAYVVPQSPPGPSVAELRQFLKKRLPAYMVPSAYVTLESFPLTPNGKVDRRALPSPHPVSTNHGPYLAPRTEIERVVAEIWEGVLQHERVGLRDDFFEMGGHSLIGFRLVAEINRAFHTSLDAADLMEAPTIEGLAQRVSTQNGSVPASKLVRLRQGRSGRSIIFLNAPMGVLPLSRLMETPHSIYTDGIPFRPEAFQASVQQNWKALPTVAELAADHTALIKDAGLAKSCILAGYSSGGVLAFEVAHQLQRDGIPVTAVLLFDADLHADGWKRLRRWARHLAAEGRRLGWSHATRVAHRRILHEWQKRAPVLGARKSLPALPTFPESSDIEDSWEIDARIWIHAHTNYRPRKLACRGVLFRVEDSIYNATRQDFDGCLGWRGQFAKGLDIFTVPGGHFSMWKDPYLPEVAKICSASLAEARRAATAR